MVVRPVGTNSQREGRASCNPGVPFRRGLKWHTHLRVLGYPHSGGFEVGWRAELSEGM
jgi:hypothetical protein